MGALAFELTEKVMIALIGAFSPAAIIGALVVWRQYGHRIENKMDTMQKVIGPPAVDDENRPPYSEEVSIDKTVIELLEGMAKDLGIVKSDIVKSRTDAATAASRARRIESKLTEHIAATVPNGHSRRKARKRP